MFFESYWKYLFIADDKKDGIKYFDQVSTDILHSNSVSHRNLQRYLTYIFNDIFELEISELYRWVRT